MIDHAYITIYTSYDILLSTYQTTYYACIEHENTISSIQHKYNSIMPMVPYNTHIKNNIYIGQWCPGKETPIHGVSEFMSDWLLNSLHGEQTVGVSKV